MTLEKQVKTIETLDDRYPIYREADVSIKEFDPDEVRPTSKYVLRDRLVLMKELQEQHDILHLRDKTRIDGYVVAPPIVENDGKTDCIVDGLHRFMVAKIKDKKVTAIHVEDVNCPDRPIIGYPVDWNKVRIRREQPQRGEDCRNLRVPDESSELRRCYRDFSVLGSDGRRPRNGQEG